MGLGTAERAMSNNFTNGAWDFITSNSSLVLSDVQSHVVISAESLGIAIVLGVPLGVWLGHIHRFSFLAINISNLGRALPSVAVLAILLPFVGIGRTDVIIALVVLAFPPILTNSYVAVDQVDPDTVDAGKGIGLKPLQVLMKVELPQALPLMFAGIRTSAVFVVATATLAGIFGGGGLGDIINNEESYRLHGVIAAAYIVILLAFAVQIAFFALERAVTPAGLRLANDRSGTRRSRRLGRIKDAVGPDDESNSESDVAEDAMAALGDRT
jgi:osmoprotectant transport system permease protein